VASVVLGFRREDVAHPCDGFGMLIPGLRVSKSWARFFHRRFFPIALPQGNLTLTSYVGGERYPELASLPPDELSL